MNIYQLIIWTTLITHCAAPSERDKHDDDSNQGSLSLNQGAVSDGFIPACSRDMSDTTQPPQKPYAVFTLNSCPTGTVPGVVVACMTKYVATNNANLSCSETGDLAIDGVKVSIGGFGCFVPNQTSLLAGCDPSILTQ